MNSLKIYIDSLKNQEELTIDQEISSDFLNIAEKELTMSEPIQIKGKVYFSDDYLIMKISLKTSFKMPCCICNEFAETPLVIEDFYHTVPTEEIKTGIYDYSQELREAILLKIPQFIECKDNNCPERVNIEKFFKKPIKNYYPFKDIK